MLKTRTAKFMLVLLFGAFILLAACSNGNNEANNDPNNEPNNAPANTEENEDNTENNENEGNEANADEEFEPVTLLMVTHWDDSQFENNFKVHVEEKYPHITLEHVQSRGDELEENVFAKNLEPDIMMESPNPYLLDMDLLLDLNPLIDLFNFDLDRLEPGVMSYLEASSNDGELNGLPYIRPEYALVYNPDIFDAFGVDYPTDNMTWEEVIELGRKVTGEVNGVQYYGLHPGNFDFMMRQLEDVQLVDPETHEPRIDKIEEFKIYLERLEQVWNVPGSGMEHWETGEDMKDIRAVNLGRDGVLAMAADRAFAGAYAGRSAETGVNFDFVTYPRWGGEYGDFGPNEPGNNMSITTLSEHPEEAFRVVEYLLSDEYQSWKAGQGDLPAVITDEVRANFMIENEHYDTILADKNLEAITSVEAAPIPIRSEFEADIMEGVGYRDGIFNGVDVNTIIREMQEQAEGNAKSVEGRN